MVSKERHRTRGALVVTQIALALILLVGSGLMVQSLLQLRSVDPGFQANNVLTINFGLPDRSYPSDGDAAANFTVQLLDRVRALPGVLSAATSNDLPIGFSGGTMVRPEDLELEPDALPPVIAYSEISDGYFATVGIPVLAGREFDASDQLQTMTGVVVSASFADRFWPNEDPVGKIVVVGLTDGGTEYAVVGMVGDILEDIQGDVLPKIYMPSVAADANPGRVTIFARTSGDPALLTSTLRQTLWNIDPNLPITQTMTLEDILSRSMASTLFTMTLFGISAVVALILGMVGVYGVISYVVSQQTREIGVRMALGASQSKVRSLVLRRGAMVTGLGVTIGLGAAVGLTRLISSLLYGIEAGDPATFAVACVLIASISLLASYIPARRAARVDPMKALRGE